MSYLLDTNVISEFTRPEPSLSVQAWMRDCQREGMYLSVITIGEIQQGIARLPASQKRQRLTDWLHQVIFKQYADYILPIDAETMLEWGWLTGDLLRQGRGMPVMDALIAATARQHHLVLATRNTDDFADAGVSLVNPWQYSAESDG